MIKGNWKWSLPILIVTPLVIFSFWRWGGDPEVRFRRVVEWNIFQNKLGLTSDDELVQWFSVPDEEIPWDLKLQGLKEWGETHPKEMEEALKKLSPEMKQNIAPPPEDEELQEFHPLSFSWGSLNLPTPFVVGMDGDPEPLNTEVTTSGPDQFAVKIQRGEAGGQMLIRISYIKAPSIAGLEKNSGVKAENTSWGSLLVDDSKIYLFSLATGGAVVLDGVPDSVQFDWEKVSWAGK